VPSRGIRVVMITGDYGLTAESVARRIGILRTAAPRILNGAEIDAMEDADLAGALKEEVLLARVTPSRNCGPSTRFKRRGTSWP